MTRVSQILEHPRFLRYMAMNAEAEKNRRFCKHDFGHVFDVARVAYILNLEKGLGIDKEIIYAAALLHDIAKWKQYADGVDHASEGAILAKEILEETGFNAAETEEITNAIAAHRIVTTEKSYLGEILYQSDKACRPCRLCSSLAECNRFSDGEIPEQRY